MAVCSLNGVPATAAMSLTGAAGRATAQTIKLGAALFQALPGPPHANGPSPNKIVPQTYTLFQQGFLLLSQERPHRGLGNIAGCDFPLYSVFDNISLVFVIFYNISNKEQ